MHESSTLGYIANFVLRTTIFLTFVKKNSCSESKTRSIKLLYFHPRTSASCKIVVLSENYSNFGH